MGQLVTVTWSGYSPGKVINILECNGGDRALTNGAACDYPHAYLLKPNPTGAGSTQRLPIVVGQVGDGICDAKHPGCFIIVNHEFVGSQDVGDDRHLLRQVAGRGPGERAAASPARELVEHSLDSWGCCHLGGNASCAIAECRIVAHRLDRLGDARAPSALLNGGRRPSPPTPRSITTPAPASATTDRVHELIREQGNDHHGDSGAERAEGRARTAVADDDVGHREHVGLVHPRLDVDVARDLTELRHVEAPADGEQHAHVELGHGIERHTVRGCRVRHVAEHGAEATYTSGWGEPSHQSGRGALGARSVSRNRRVSGNGDGSSDAGNLVTYGEPSRSSTSPGRWSSSAGAAISMDPHSTSASPIPICRDRRVWGEATTADAYSHGSRSTRSGFQLRMSCSIAGSIASVANRPKSSRIGQDRSLVGRGDGELLPDRRDDRLGRLVARRERVARLPDHRRQRRRPDDERLVALIVGRRRGTRAAGCRCPAPPNEHAARTRTRQGYAAVVRDGSLCRRCDRRRFVRMSGQSGFSNQ